MGANALGCYGNSIVRTPHMDRMATEGLRFSNCFSQNPVCVPSRSSLHTGQYVLAHGVRDNNCNPAPDKSHRTFAQELRENGYETAYYGKTHALDGRHDEWDDVFDLYPDYNRYLKGRKIDVKYPERPRVEDLCAGVSQIPYDDFSEVVLGNLGESYIRARRDSDKPFFLFMSHEAPHSPWTVPEEVADLYSMDEIKLPDVPDEDFSNKKDWRLAYMKKRVEYATEESLKNAVRTYYTLTSIIDRQVGRYLEALEETGLLENTYVIIMADHGDHIGNHRSMGKCLSLDDSLIHVPMIWYAPGRVKTGVVDELAESIDFFPTIMELAGIPCPSGVQGKNLSACLSGKCEPVRECTFSEEYSDAWGALMCARDKRYKLTVFDDGYEELYDLEQDPYEWYNLTCHEELTSVRDDLRMQLLRWRFASADRTTPQRFDWVTRFMTPGNKIY
jgi:arylsulfatase A-like enzyme